jgi:NAD(P)-dependent dehydrogenase (short-subunit alcohol dehydrogenase family)
MSNIPYRTALIVGAGPGISASLARALTANGVKVGLAAREPDRLATLAGETGAVCFEVDAAEPDAVASLFEQVEARIGEPDLVVYNASGRTRGPIAELDPEAVRQSLAISAYGGFLVTQQAAPDDPARARCHPAHRRQSSIRSSEVALRLHLIDKAALYSVK